MKMFLGCTIGFSILAYAVLMVLGVLLGNGGFLIAALLAAGAVFALFACVLDKLTQLEEKLDRLMKEKAVDSAEG